MVRRMLTQDTKLRIFRLILDMNDEEAAEALSASRRILNNLRFQQAALPACSQGTAFETNLEAAKLAHVIAQQRHKDIGKPETVRESNMRGLCAMLEIEHYQATPTAEELPKLEDCGIRL